MAAPTVAVSVSGSQPRGVGSTESAGSSARGRWGDGRSQPQQERWGGGGAGRGGGVGASPSAKTWAQGTHGVGQRGMLEGDWSRLETP